MKYLKISNQGVLDMRLISLMGGTTKANDQFKIGKFGTGLKYYISWCLRNNVDFRIFCGTEEVKIKTVDEHIAGQDFAIMYVNEERSSVTTTMGHDWKAWMIIREIWCNALDEGDAQREETTTLEGYEGRTTFYTQIIPDIAQIIREWSLYFLQDVTPIWKSDNYSIYPGGEGLRLYKNGVLIYKSGMKDFRSVFSYDIKDASINELREFKGVVSMDIANALFNVDENTAKYFLDTIRNNHLESTMDLEWGDGFGKEWGKALGDSKLIHEKAAQSLIERGIDVDLSQYLMVPENFYNALIRKFPKARGLVQYVQGLEFYEQHNEKLASMVAHAVEQLKECGYEMNPELSYTYGLFQSRNAKAQINRNEKVIYVSNTMVSDGMQRIMGMLVEENEHYKTGFNDHTREFQQHFIDLYLSELVARRGEGMVSRTEYVAPLFQNHEENV